MYDLRGQLEYKKYYIDLDAYNAETPAETVQYVYDNLGRRTQVIAGSDTTTYDYDAEGNQILTDGKLTFESIYRFKGQEAPAVILVDVDPREDRRGREEQLLYCGMTRATVRLDLVVREGNPTNRRFLQA